MTDFLGSMFSSKRSSIFGGDKEKKVAEPTPEVKKEETPKETPV